MITAFAICNNVTPVPDDPDLDHALEVFQGDKVNRSTVPPDLNSGKAVLEVERVGSANNGSSSLRKSLEKPKLP